jgi:hypothetical protein
MLSPEAILTFQVFAYGMAQNLISSAIVEWKKLKNDRKAQENAAWLEKVEHSKSLENRMVQAVCEAFRNSRFTNEQFQLVLPLSSDLLFGSDLAQQILADTCSREVFRSIILRYSPNAETLGVDVNQFATSLLAAIQSAIADDPHLHRVKQLQFQANITDRVAEVKAETAKTQDAIRETGQTVVGQIQELSALVRQKLLSDSTAEFEVREKIYHARIEQSRKLMEGGQPKTARRLLVELRSGLSSSNPSKALLFRIATNIGGWDRSQAPLSAGATKPTL